MDQWLFETIGTHWTISSQPLHRTIRSQITDLYETYDATYSRFKDANLIDFMRHTPGTYALPPDAKRILDFYWQLYIATKGKVTPLIGATLEKAGYDKTYSLKSSALSPPSLWETSFSYTATHITAIQPFVLDLGAAGKGYLIDNIATILKKHGLVDFVINGGGDVYVHGEPLLILLEDPNDTTRALGEVSLRNHSLCASAGNRRRWGAYHHIIDPQTMTSPKHIQAVWVSATSAMVADGLSTALFFVPPETLLPLFTFEYAIIEADSLRVSKNFHATWYT